MKTSKHTLLSVLIAGAALVAACTTEKKSDDDDDTSSSSSGGSCADACSKLAGCGMCVSVDGQCLSESDCTSGCQSEGQTALAQCVNNVSGCDEGALSACFGPGCDDGSYGSLESTLCDSCFSCALEGACAGLLTTCQNSGDCQSFLACVDPCTTDACYDSCSSQYPTGSQQYLDVLSCGICVECPNNCDAASNCV